MEKVFNFIFLILYLIGNIGCSSEEEDFLSLATQENIKALSASTRSVVITVCSDAFVDVGGYSEYKGTTCKTYSIGGGGIPSGGYSPGGFPQHGIFEDQGTGGGRKFLLYRRFMEIQISQNARDIRCKINFKC